MKRGFILNLLVVLTMLIMFSCSKKEDPAPGNDKEEPGPGNGPGTEEVVSYDDNYAVYQGKANYAVMQPDGKVILAGTSKNTAAAIYRVDKDGKHDSSFNIDQDKSWVIKSIEGLALQLGGNVIVAGVFVINGKTYDVIRLNNTGLLDRSFAFHEFSEGRFDNMHTTALVTQTDGKIIFAKTFTNIGKRYIDVERLNANGPKDSGFTSFYPNSLNSSSDASVHQILPLPDGNIFICGELEVPGKARYVVKLQSNGNVDPSFYFKERIRFSSGYSGSPRAMEMQNDGKILIVGSFDEIVDESQRDTKISSANVFRINSDGSLDKSFISNKQPLLPVDVVVRQDNSFIIIGNGNATIPQVALFNPDGGLKIGYKIADEKSVLKRIFKQSESQFLIAGDIINSNASEAVARLNIK